MKKYYVTIPIAGFVTIEVDTEATSDRDIIDAAYEEYDKDVDAQYIEWELCEKIVQGNVLHAPLNEVEIEEA